MKKFLASSLTALTLVTATPAFSDSKTEATILEGRAKIEQILEKSNLQINYNEIYAELENTLKTGVGEAYKENEKFFWEFFGYLAADNDIDTFIQDMRDINFIVTDEALKKLESKFGKGFQKIYYNYLFFTTVKILAEDPSYPNFFPNSNLEDFYYLSDDLVDYFKGIGFEFVENIGDYDNFTFKFDEKGVLQIVAMLENSKDVIGVFSKQDKLKSDIKDVFDIVLDNGGFVAILETRLKDFHNAFGELPEIEKQVNELGISNIINSASNLQENNINLGNILLLTGVSELFCVWECRSNVDELKLEDVLTSKFGTDFHKNIAQYIAYWYLDITNGFNFDSDFDSKFSKLDINRDLFEYLGMRFLVDPSYYNNYTFRLNDDKTVNLIASDNEDLVLVGFIDKDNIEDIIKKGDEIFKFISAYGLVVNGELIY